MRKISKVEPARQAIPKRKRVAAYARVSRDTERLAHSLSAQVSYYSALIQGNPEWEYAGVYADFAVSGTGTEHRDEFRRLIEDCEAGNIDIVLTKSISRFARNTVDLLETVRHLKSLGIEVRFEKEHINSMSGDGELMLSILASFAQEESRSISENCKWGIRKRFRSGEIGAANKHILGYRYDEEQKKYVVIPEEAEAVRRMFRMYLDGLPLREIAESMNDAGVRTTLGNEFQEASVRRGRFLGYDRGEDGNLVINEEQAKVVRKIYGLFLQGHSPYAIAKRLTAEGIPTPGGKKVWGKAVVQSILTNEKYKGDALLQKVYTVDFLTKKKKVNEGEVPQYYVEGNHPAIIEPAVFDQVQVLMQSRTPGKDRNSSVGIFSGRIKCGDCGSWYGSKVWHSNDKYRRVIWQCNHKFDGGEKCTTPHLDEETIKGLFIKALNILCTERDEIVAAFEAIRDTAFRTDELEAEQDRLREEMKVVADMVQRGIDENAHVAQDQTEYEKRYNALADRFDKTQARLDEVGSAIQKKQAQREMMHSFVDSVKELPETVDYFDEGAWYALVDYATVYGRADVRFTFKNGTEIKVEA